MSSSIQLKQTVALASKYIYNAPLLYTNDGELALRAGDFVRQFILSPPFAWRWNRGFTSVTTIVGQTDYTVPVSDFGWLEKASITQPPIAFITDQILTATRTSNTVVLQVKTDPRTLGFQGGQTITVADVNDPSFDGTNAFVISALDGTTITYYQAGTNATSTGGSVMYQTNTGTGVLQTQELEVKNSLSAESLLGLPRFISSLGDDNNGNITFRIQPASDLVYTLNIIYQRSSKVFSSLSDTWWPIPDYLNYLYTSGYIAKAYEYKGDERFAYATQQFLRQVLAAADGVSEEAKNIFLEPKIIASRELQNVTQSGTLARQGRVS